MNSLFHHVFAVISVALGVLMAVMGSIWVLQGLGIAFLNSFMANQIQWSIYGAILVVLGIGEIYWVATRARYFRTH